VAMTMSKQEIAEQRFELIAPLLEPDIEQAERRARREKILERQRLLGKPISERLIIGGILQNPLLAIKLLGLVGAIMYFIYGVLLLNLAKVKRAKVVRAVITIVLKSVPFILVPTMGIYMNFQA